MSKLGELEISRLNELACGPLTAKQVLFRVSPEYRKEVLAQIKDLMEEVTPSKKLIAALEQE